MGKEGLTEIVNLYWGNKLEKFVLSGKRSKSREFLEAVGLPTLSDWDDFPLQFLHFHSPAEDEETIYICGAYGFEFFVRCADEKVFLREPHTDKLRYVNSQLSNFLYGANLLHKAYHEWKMHESALDILQEISGIDPEIAEHDGAWWAYILPQLTSDY